MKKIIISIGVIFLLMSTVFGIKYFLFSGEPKVVVAELDEPTWRTDIQITNESYISYVDKYSIIRDTDSLGGGAAKYYSKYIDYISPNGKAIRLLAQDQVTDSQVLYAYSVLTFYLNNLDEDVANQMADNEAVLILPNGTHRETKMSIGAMLGHELYQNEISNVGSNWYIENDYEYRDASLEEIFHLVHDTGIGTSQNEQANPELAQLIASATLNALPTNQSDWGESGLWGLGSVDWLEELKVEGSLEQEYFVSVLDSYYGLWEAWTESDGGMWGLYVAKSREEIEEKDPVGYEMITSFLPEYINVFMPVDEAFIGTFDMNYNDSTPYTAKSQYLQNLILQGENDINILGNDQDNIFMGNSGVNIIDGGKGYNIIQLRGSFAQYVIMKNDDETITVEDEIEGRDGKLILENIQMLRFIDKDFAVSELE